MTESGLRLLDALGRDLGAVPVRSLDDVWEGYRDERALGSPPFISAVLVATQVDRLGFAFAAAYPAALEVLVDGVRPPSALCVTEAGGNAPRAIETELESRDGGYELTGTKSFVTFGALAETLLVVARAGEKPDGRPDLAVLEIPANRSGIALRELPKTSFIPEIPHTAVHFDRVEVRDNERLPGDGYLRYVKPFRTIEDIHVVGATLGYLLGLGRRTQVSATLLAEMIADLVALDGLRKGAPLDPRVHVALHGVYQRMLRLAQSEALSRLMDAAPDDERSRWTRDRPLLEIASKARDTRFERAQSMLG